MAKLIAACVQLFESLIVAGSVLAFHLFAASLQLSILILTRDCYSSQQPSGRQKALAQLRPNSLLVVCAVSPWGSL